MGKKLLKNRIVGDRGGFTLVELIVTLTIACGLLVAIIALISPTSNIFHRVNSSSDAKQMTESILSEIRNDASKSRAISADPADEKGNNSIVMVNGEEHEVIFVNSSGQLSKTVKKGGSAGAGKTTDIFDSKFYNGHTIKMTAKNDNGTVDVTLKVYDGDRITHDVTTTLSSALNDVASINDEEPEPEDNGNGDVGDNEEAYDPEESETPDENVATFHITFWDSKPSLVTNVQGIGSATFAVIETILARMGNNKLVKIGDTYIMRQKSLDAYTVIYPDHVFPTFDGILAAAKRGGANGAKGYIMVQPTGTVDKKGNMIYKAYLLMTNSSKIEAPNSSNTAIYDTGGAKPGVNQYWLDITAACETIYE